MQDAAAWLTLAVALVLAPWDALYTRVGLTPPDPAAPFVVAGLALAAVAALHALRGGRTAVAVAATADVVAALAVAAWLVLDTPATSTLGTVVLAVVAAGLALQAVFDVLMLGQGRH